MILDPNEYKHVLTGSEPIQNKGQKTGYTMLNFWQLSLSDIGNALIRGTFAEFLVRCALRQSGMDAFQESNGTTNSWDITVHGVEKTLRIEVKCAGSSKSGMPDHHSFDSRVRFDIRKKPGKKRPSNLYVFCRFSGHPVVDELLEMKNWEFYVCPTERINEQLGDKNGVSVFRLRRMNIAPCDFADLGDSVLKYL